MSYRLIDANALAMDYKEVNDMPCIYADLPNGLDDGYYDFARAERTCIMYRRGSSTDNRECSECGASYRGDVLYPLNYCPNCGAKVVSE